MNTAELRAKYEKDGYLVIENFVAPEQLDELRKRYEYVVNNIPDEEMTSVFSTTQQAKLTDEYFLTSGDKVRPFLEEKAKGTDGNLVAQKHLAINKVGHALYELDEVFKKFTGTEDNVKVAKEVLNMKKPLVAQSMYICKQPKIGGQVSPHQDGSFLFTTPESVNAFWFPVDDATIQNACIWVVPGSHTEELRTRFKLNHETRKLYFDPPANTITWPDDSAYIPVEVKKGSVVLIHGRVAHKSSENFSDQARHAYTFHLVDGETKYDADNWLQRPTPFAPLEAV